ncbi:MAG: hypothetical protein KFB97_11425 [Cyanobium sp. M30B3]|nr:MAG: hypothetical protein KFB97_11425 [Cyanobium sp. M30B3]
MSAQAAIPAPVDVVVIGGGLAGGLLALELAAASCKTPGGLTVQLVDAASPHQASQWSYGALAPFAGGHWARLQRRHGDLGWRRRWFRPWGPGAPLGGRLPLPCSRVEAAVLRRQLPGALERAGCACARAGWSACCRPPPQVSPGGCNWRALPNPWRPGRWCWPPGPAAGSCGRSCPSACG